MVIVSSTFYFHAMKVTKLLVTFSSCAVHAHKALFRVAPDADLQSTQANCGKDEANGAEYRPTPG